MIPGVYGHMDELGLRVGLQHVDRFFLAIHGEKALDKKDKLLDIAYFDLFLSRVLA